MKLLLQPNSLPVVGPYTQEKNYMTVKNTDTFTTQRSHITFTSVICSFTIYVVFATYSRPIGYKIYATMLSLYINERLTKNV